MPSPERSATRDSPLVAPAWAPAADSAKHASTAVVPSPVVTKPTPGGNAAVDPVPAAWPDLVADSRVGLLRLSARHAARVAALGLASALPVVAVVALCVMLQNYVAQVYAHRGHDTAARVSSHDALFARLSGSPARSLLALQAGLLTLATGAWIVFWLVRIARDNGRALSRGWWAAAAVVSLVDSASMYANVASDAYSAPVELNFFLSAAVMGALGHRVGCARGFGRLLMFTYVCATAALYGYLFVLPALFYSSATTRQARVMLLSAAHPLLVELAVAPARAMARRAPVAARHTIMLYAHIVHTAAGVAGRSYVFAIAGSAASTAALVVALGASETLMRVTMVSRDAAYSCGRGGGFSAERARQVRAEVVGAHEITEVTSIVVAAASALLYDSGSSAGAVVASAALQLGAELVCDLLPAAAAGLCSPGVRDAPWPLRSFRRVHMNIERAAVVWQYKSMRRTLRDLVAGAAVWTAYMVAAAHAPFTQFCLKEGAGAGGWNAWRSCWGEG